MTTSQGTATAWPHITALHIENYKSIRKLDLEIKPLTILAGANSSGKSSAIQPLLLLKQTLDSPSDPGAMKLDGPHVVFDRFDEMISRSAPSGELRIGISVLRLQPDDPPARMVSTFRYDDASGTAIVSGMEVATPLGTFQLTPQMTELVVTAPLAKSGRMQFEVVVREERCFLRCTTSPPTTDTPSKDPQAQFVSVLTDPILYKAALFTVTHVPGLRSPPERSYSRRNGSSFAGFFTDYTASILHDWERQHAEQWQRLPQQLANLRLASGISTSRLNDAQIELRVGRDTGKPFNPADTVSIADVGLGVSQSLPILVALLRAEPGQLVYIEQPELHLHPRAQVALAGPFIEAAKRGVRVVCETHSSLFITAIQTAIAHEQISKDEVSLVWFNLDENQETQTTVAELDDAGRWGDWPADFDEVSLKSSIEYLDAVERRHIEQLSGGA